MTAARAYLSSSVPTAADVSQFLPANIRNCMPAMDAEVKMLPDALSRRKPITSSDIISVRGRYLFVGGEERFFVKGIGFPTPPPSQTARYYNKTVNDQLARTLNLSGWIAVLEQLARDTDVNTVRLYEMDCRFDYSQFLNRGAELGIYFLVPLTTIKGPGVLPREKSAPSCYPQKLFKYGSTCLQNYWEHPNIIAGVVGNEVMNDLKAWHSAPCLKAYLDDLARYGRSLGRTNGRRKYLPLIYATQHDSPSAEQLPDEAIKLTLDYLNCNSDGKEMRKILDDTFLFGINIESWCSSLQTFEYEEDGTTESSYYSLWKALSNGTKTERIVDAISGEITVTEIPTVSPKAVRIPVIFTEMGCSKNLFNRENNVQPKLVRDWKQIPIVTDHGKMTDVISGFVAYGYDGGGNVAFSMMESTVWNGKEPLATSPDYDNFRTELSEVVTNRGVQASHDDVNTDTPPELNNTGTSCKEISAKLAKLWAVDLYPMEDMPSYSSQSKPRLNVQTGVEALLLRGSNIERTTSSISALAAIILLPAVCLVSFFVAYCKKRDNKRGQYQQL